MRELFSLNQLWRISFHSLLLGNKKISQVIKEECKSCELEIFRIPCSQIWGFFPDCQFENSTLCRNQIPVPSCQRSLAASCFSTESLSDYQFRIIFRRFSLNYFCFVRSWQDFHRLASSWWAKMCSSIFADWIWSSSRDWLVLLNRVWIVSAIVL